MAPVMFKASSCICRSVPYRYLSTEDSKDICNGILTLFSRLNQLVTNAVTRFNKIVSEAFEFTNSTIQVSTPYLLSTLHSACVETTDLVSISVLLEKESLTSLSIGLSSLTLILAISNCLLVVASSPIRSIFRVGIALTITAAVC